MRVAFKFKLFFSFLLFVSCAAIPLLIRYTLQIKTYKTNKIAVNAKVGYGVTFGNAYYVHNQILFY